MKMQKLSNSIIRVWIFFVCISCIFLKTEYAFAEEISGKRNSLDIMFVVDVSGSMRSNDPNTMALEMVEAFIDTVHTETVRIGFVAYNDSIVSAIAPVSVLEASDRDNLKQQVRNVSYSGNTDIGLGLTCAYDLIQQEASSDQIIILLSDGESDLSGSTTGRTLEQSDAEIEAVIKTCQINQIPVHTIAFGSYGGSTDCLQKIADETSASIYAAQSPELLIEILYNILHQNLSYKIQQFSTGLYASGNQEIYCVLDGLYLNEIDILLISSGQVGETSIRYGEKEIPVAAMSSYAVGKISGSDLNAAVKEITINTETVNGQEVMIYIITYRNLEPFLKLDTKVAKNQIVPYQVYFKDDSGNIITDTEFYKTFDWNQTLSEFEIVELKDGILQGQVQLKHSGNYRMEAQLADDMGCYQFVAEINACNTLPVGELPELKVTALRRDITWKLNSYFTDVDGDILQYALDAADMADFDIQLSDDKLTINPRTPGRHTFEVLVSDGEDVLVCPVSITIVPLWQAYWWVMAIALLLFCALLWKLRQKQPLAESQDISDIQSRCHFNGRLDLYFTVLPETTGEIPPLVFQMHKVRGSKIRLGALLTGYPEEVRQLGLDEVHLIADEERKMLLYHSSESTVMIGNSIVCKKVCYSISFGDVIYITTADGYYDLELHYISVIQ